MQTYTGTADANGDFNISFGSNNYTSGEKITVTAEKNSAIKSIELYAPAAVTGGGVIQFGGTLNNFPNNIGAVTISEIANIGTGAFYAYNTNFFTKATELNLVGTVAIGVDAFYGWNMISLSLPVTLTTISASAFAYCRNVKSLIIPDSVVSIGDSAFQGWSAAESLVLSSSIATIANSVFNSWSSAKSLIIPDSVVSIGTNAFNGWSSAKSLTIGAATRSVAGLAFYNWSACDVITCLAITPPTIQTNSFGNLKATCIIKVPAASVAAYQAAANWSAFASRIQAI